MSIKNYKLVFMGTPEFAVEFLRHLKAGGILPDLIITQPDKPQGRKMELCPPPAKVWGQDNEVPVWQPEKARDEDFLNKLREFKPDLILTASYGQILPQALLDIPRYGCLNVHPSLLPLYRGASPVQAAIIAGDTVTGVTVMIMEAGLDSGPILSQKEYPLTEDITAGELLLDLARLGADMVLELLPAFLAGEIEAREQDDSQATYAGRLDRETGKVDWTLSARKIHNLIRGTQPWPGAYTYCAGKRLKILSSSVLDDSGKNFAPPGTLVSCRNTITVACGTGLIDLEIIQPAGSRIMPCCDCAHNYSEGTVLGE